MSAIWAGVGALDGHARMAAVAAGPQLNGAGSRLLVTLSTGSKGWGVWLGDETRIWSTEGRSTTQVVVVDGHGWVGIVAVDGGAEDSPRDDHALLNDRFDLSVDWNEDLGGSVRIHCSCCLGCYSVSSWRMKVVKMVVVKVVLSLLLLCLGRVRVDKTEGTSLSFIQRGCERYESYRCVYTNAQLP